MAVGTVGGGVSEFEVAARATRGIPVAACAATGDVCDVESIVWVVGRAEVGDLQIGKGEADPLDKGGAIGGVVGCADWGCASLTAGLLGADTRDASACRDERFFFFVRTVVQPG